MFDMKLTRAPVHYNESRVPLYEIDQFKGLQVNQSDILTKSAEDDGYTQKIGIDIYNIIKNEIYKISNGTRLDMLEIGGGSGSFFDCVDDRLSSYINVDPSLVLKGEGVEKRLRNERYGCIQCSAEDIPLNDGVVDVVVAISSLDHMPDVDKVLSEICRILKPDGYFVLSLNNRKSWWKKLLSGTDYLRRREEMIAKEHYFQWSVSECDECLSKYFHSQKLFTITYFPHVKKIWKLFLPVFDAVGRLLFPNLGGNMVYVGKKYST